MSRQARIILWVVVSVIAFVILAGLILPAIPSSHCTRTEYQYCLNCGTIRCLQEDGEIGAPPQTTTEVLKESTLSAWYVEHFGNTCAHEWKRASVSRHLYRPLFGFVIHNGAASSTDRRPLILRAFADYQPRCDEMFRSDNESCRRFIGEELRKDSKSSN
jgi:hypothetical protein